MYKIVGSDGKQYGPLSMERLNQWIVEARRVERRDSGPRGRLRRLDVFGSAAGICESFRPPDVPAPSTGSNGTNPWLCHYRIGLRHCIHCFLLLLRHSLPAG